MRPQLTWDQIVALRDRPPSSPPAFTMCQSMFDRLREVVPTTKDEMPRFDGVPVYVYPDGEEPPEGLPPGTVHFVRAGS